MIRVQLRNKYDIDMLLCLFLTSYQQLRSYGDGTTALKSLIRQTGEARDRTCDPWFTKQVAYPLQHSR